MRFHFSRSYDSKTISESPLTMRIGFFQFCPEFGNLEANRERMANALENADADLIVFPELANSGYFFSDRNELMELSETVPGPTVRRLQEAADRYGRHAVLGICERDGSAFYNAAVLIRPRDEIRVYRKLHLFDTEKNWFSPGDIPLRAHEIRLSQGVEVRIGMMICFDWRFPEVARKLALSGTQILCHPSNLVMPHAQGAMITRCLENRIFAVTANRTGTDGHAERSISFTGCSQIVDPAGRVLGRATPDGEELVVVEVDPVEALEKGVTSRNHLWEDRRPEWY